jgi:hypothetical protein
MYCICPMVTIPLQHEWDVLYTFGNIHNIYIPWGKRVHTCRNSHGFPSGT